MSVFFSLKKVTRDYQTDRSQSFKPTLSGFLFLQNCTSKEKTWISFEKINPVKKWSKIDHH